MSTQHTSLDHRQGIKVTFQPMDLTHDKLRILQNLDAIIVEKLFGNAAWPPIKTERTKISQRLIELGFKERVGHRTTALGQELHHNILYAFLGLWEPSDLLIVLAENGLIEKEVFYDLCEELGSDCEQLFKLHVIAAYKAYYKKVCLFAPGRWRI